MFRHLTYPSISVPLLIATWLHPATLSVAKSDEMPKIKSLDLTTVYSTSAQPGLKYIIKEFDGDSKEREAVLRIGEKLADRQVRPLAFFVRADTISDALLGTLQGLESKTIPRDAKSLRDKGNAKVVWLFAYIKHDPSDPPQWEILPPRLYLRQMRFEYKVADIWPRVTDSSTADSRPYMYWIPLGEQKANQFVVELVEWKKRETGSFPKR